MGAEIGDSVAVDGRVGEVVGFAGKQALVRPFPIAEQQNTPGSPPCFVAQGEVVVLKKHFERTTSADFEHQQLVDRARARSEAVGVNHYARAAQIDRGWYQERDR